jgi:hypothetical protein
MREMKPGGIMNFSHDVGTIARPQRRIGKEEREDRAAEENDANGSPIIDNIYQWAN